MLNLDHDTLAYYKANPFLNPVDFSQTPVPKLSEQIRVDRPALGQAYPEAEALTFYLYNHAFSLVTSRLGLHEPMGDFLPVAVAYAQSSAKVFKRLMQYMVLITTRESRHVHNSESFWEKVGAEFGPEFLAFQKRISHTSSTGAVEKFHSHPPDMPFGQYMAGITHVFNKGKFSGGYGGKPWGQIANTLRSMVMGETSPEIMVDTAWTLCHNNGPMFNKGMLYHMYSSEIKKILDVQRSGQIPQYFAEVSNSFTQQVPGFQMLQTLFPQEMNGYVDWFLVEELGSVQKYPSEKALQANKYGEPEPKPEPLFGKKVYITESEYIETMMRAA